MFHVIDSALQSSAPISNAVKLNGMVFTAQIPRIPGGDAIELGEFSKQAQRTFENLKLMLESAGGTMASVVQLTVFLVNGSDGPKMNEIYRQFFSAPYPNRASVVVKELMVPGMLIEITVQAWIGE